MDSIDSARETKPSPSPKPAAKRLTVWQKIYTAIGFSKGYNLPLFIIFAGAMFGFSLARLSYLNISGSARSSFASGAVPGEWYWYRKDHYRVGITLHLGCILPAGVLMIWQFIPIIRHKALLFHRINGYIVILLVLLGNVGALMIARRAFGGTLDTQVVVGVLVILTTASVMMAYYNIKHLQVEQHRAWILRSMFYFGVIITARIIMVITAQLISRSGGYYTVMPCDEIAFITNNESFFQTRYPQCDSPNGTTDGYAIVKANFSGGKPEELGVSLGIGFGMAMWLALLLHLVGVEIYLALTPAEKERLRALSYEKQLEAGLQVPGSAGLTADRAGDAAPWRPLTTSVGKRLQS